MQKSFSRMKVSSGCNGLILIIGELGDKFFAKSGEAHNLTKYRRGFSVRRGLLAAVQCWIIDPTSKLFEHCNCLILERLGILITGQSVALADLNTAVELEVG